MNVLLYELPNGKIDQQLTQNTAARVVVKVITSQAGIYMASP